MKVRDFFLANSAETRDGLCYVLGAFPERWLIESAPSKVTLAFVLVLDYTDKPDDRAGFQVAHQSPAGLETTLIQIAASRPPSDKDLPDSPRIQPSAFDLDVIFEEVGLHYFNLYRFYGPGPSGNVSRASEPEIRYPLFVRVPPEMEVWLSNPDPAISNEN
jgi:hypothetical protein